MQVVSAREFRTNQTAVLSRALKGESILLTSRLGAFKIVPVTEADSLSTRVCEGLQEAAMIEKGLMKGYSVDELLNEL